MRGSRLARAGEGLTVTGPEAAYAKCVAHWRDCEHCSAAGGEWGATEDLCPQGRALTEAWERAERSYSYYVRHAREAEGLELRVRQDFGTDPSLTEGPTGLAAFYSGRYV
jgi:hypothetical protein